RANLRKKVMEASGKEAISRAFDRYVKKLGMPDDFEILEQGLEHANDDSLEQVIQHLDQLLDREKPRRSRTMQGKLRFIEETSDNRQLGALASLVRAKLS